MLFKNQFNGRVRKTSNIGSPEKQKYIAKYDKEGVLRLEENGTENLYDEIQSHKESCSIKAILRRYANGDVDALNRVQGAYLDVSNMPTNMAEMLNLTIRAEQDFNSLPVEIKSKFGHNFAAWLSTAGTDMWLENMGVKPNPEVTPELTPESTPKEEKINE